MADLVKLAWENVEAYGADDWTRLKAVLTPDCLYDEVGSQRRLQGAEEMVQAYQGWKQAIPDGKGAIGSTFVNGNKVAQEVTWTGTHNGPLNTPQGAIPPSGKSISVPGVQIITFEGDKIVEFRQFFNLLTLLQQIGAAPQ
ncbi:MAG: ester cyclase [Dehalococcoidia bacterium]|nr:ester cyclase [Dehalococcoidia bacterium]